MTWLDKGNCVFQCVNRSLNLNTNPIALEYSRYLDPSSGPKLVVTCPNVIGDLLMTGGRDGRCELDCRLKITVFVDIYIQ